MIVLENEITDRSKEKAGGSSPVEGGRRINPNLAKLIMRQRSEASGKERAEDILGAAFKENHEKLEEFISSENQRYTAMGKEINCQQKPLNNGAFKSDIVSSLQENVRYAYVWYVASLQYLCSALTAMRLLRKARLVKEGK